MNTLSPARVTCFKASVRRAGVSRTSQARDLEVTAAQLILETVASATAGEGLVFRVPFIFIVMKLKLGAKVTKQDTYTIDITLVPAKDAAH